jgi:GTP cyclohydrolase I
MQAFDNPVFVEDVVRTVAVQLRSDARIAWFRVYAVNEESIHSHSVFARVEGPEPFTATRPVKVPTLTVDMPA